MSVNSTEKGVILIVDDTPTNLEVLFDFLANCGFKVLVAEDGKVRSSGPNMPHPT
jgi:two-component system cell cycle sensor histidine kinase/response regulator CckA